MRHDAPEPGPGPGPRGIVLPRRPGPITLHAAYVPLACGTRAAVAWTDGGGELAKATRVAGGAPTAGAAPTAAPALSSPIPAAVLAATARLLTAATAAATSGRASSSMILGATPSDANSALTSAQYGQYVLE